MTYNFGSQLVSAVHFFNVSLPREVQNHSTSEAITVSKILPSVAIKRALGSWSHTERLQVLR